MKNQNKWATTAFFLLFLLPIIGFRTWAADPAHRHRIFILHSYEKGHVCGQPQHDGVVEALKGSGFIPGENIELKVFYMDTKRKNNTPELIEKVARIALYQVKAFHPDVLVTLDDNAFRTVALKFLDTPLSIVFSGMNLQPEDYNQRMHFFDSRKRPGHNITGVYEKLHIVDAIRIQVKIIPDLKKLRMLSDLSPTGRAITRQVELELKKADLRCRFDIKVVRTWEEYQREIKLINETDNIGSIYPAALLLKDKSGKTYTAPEIFRWTIRYCQKPAIAINYAFAHLGLFGGAAVDFQAMGMQAGDQVVKILNGSKPGNLPIEDAERYALVFNLDRAHQLGIKIPEDILLAADEVITRSKK